MSDYTCAIEGCGRAGALKLEGKHLCNGHLKRAMGMIDPSRPIAPRVRQRRKCAVADCERKCWAKGYCNAHYQRHRLGAVLEAPMREMGQKMISMRFLNVHDWADEAVRRSAKQAGVSISMMLRAIVEGWATTQGALRQPVKADRLDAFAKAWSRGQSVFHQGPA